MQFGLSLLISSQSLVSRFSVYSSKDTKLRCFLFLVETTRFVELLFSVLKSETYLPLTPRPSDMASLPPHGAHSTPLIVSDEKRLVSLTQNRKVSEDFSRQDSVIDTCSNCFSGHVLCAHSLQCFSCKLVDWY